MAKKLPKKQYSSGEADWICYYMYYEERVKNTSLKYAVCCTVSQSTGPLVHQAADSSMSVMGLCDKGRPCYLSVKVSKASTRTFCFVLFSLVVACKLFPPELCTREWRRIYWRQFPWWIFGLECHIYQTEVFQEFSNFWIKMKTIDSSTVYNRDYLCVDLIYINGWLSHHNVS